MLKMDINMQKQQAEEELQNLLREMVVNPVGEKVQEKLEENILQTENKIIKEIKTIHVIIGASGRELKENQEENLQALEQWKSTIPQQISVLHTNLQSALAGEREWLIDTVKNLLELQCIELTKENQRYLQSSFAELSKHLTQISCDLENRLVEHSQALSKEDSCELAGHVARLSDGLKIRIEEQSQTLIAVEKQHTTKLEQFSQQLDIHASAQGDVITEQQRATALLQQNGGVITKQLNELTRSVRTLTWSMFGFSALTVILLGLLIR